MHATVLNKVVSEMKESSGDPSSYDSIDEYMGGRPLKEVLGHTPRQASVAVCLLKISIKIRHRC